MSQKIFQKIKKVIKTTKNIAIVSHWEQDGDSLGSMIALSLALNQINKRNIIFANTYPEEYSWLARKVKIAKKIPNLFKPDVIFVLDSSNIGRVKMEKLFCRDSFIINIDHHLDNARFGDINFVKDTSSVGEMLFSLLKYLKVKTTLDMAEAIYVAMMTDTGGFRFANTKKTTFEIAAQLIAKGIKPYEIVKKVYESRNLSELDVYSEAFKNINCCNKGKILYTSLSSASKMEARSVIDFIRTIKGTEVVLVFKKINRNLIKVSMRSKGKTDVSKMARTFNGGGHKQASACVIEGREKDVVRRVLEEARKEISSRRL